MPVYDEEAKRADREAVDAQTAHNFGGDAHLGNRHGATSDEGVSKRMARHVLDQEKSAAMGGLRRAGGSEGGTGGRLSAGGMPGGGSGNTPTGGDARKSLNGQESSGLYNANDDGGKQKWWTRKRKGVAAGGLISLLVGGGLGGGLGANLAGPLQFIHIAEVLNGLHFEEKNDQGATRLLYTIRNIRYALRGEYQRTRMGYIGNYYADRIEKKMNSRGVTVEYDGAGNFTGYKFDPSKLSSEDYPDLKERTPEALQAYLKEKYNLEAVIVGGLLVVPKVKSYFKNNAMLKSVLKFTGWKQVSPLTTRTMGVRADAGFHVLRVLSGDTLDDRYRSWATKRVEKIKTGAKKYLAARSDKDSAGNQAQGDNGSLDETNKEAAEAAEKAATGDSSGMKALKASIKAKLTGTAGKGVMAAVILFCVMQAFARDVDEQSYLNNYLPLARMGVEAIALGDQVKYGKMGGAVEGDDSGAEASGGATNDLDVEQLGFFADLNYDPEEMNGVMDAMSIQASLQQPLSGPDISSEALPNPEGNFLTRILDVPILNGVCDVLNNSVVAIVGTVVGFALGPVVAAVQTAVSILAIDPLVEALAKIFAGQTVDVMAQGAERGNFVNYGARLAANEISTSRGGLPMSSEDEAEIASATQSQQQWEFDHQNLAYKLFDSNDPKSLLSQVVDDQAPDPADNMSRMAVSFLNIGNTFGSMVGGVLSRSAGAAPVNAKYDYHGVPDVAYTSEEMNDDNYSNPFANAEKAADLLDATEDEDGPDNYATRIKTCFGIEIVKTPTDEAPDGQYSIQPPVIGASPMPKVVLDSSNECLAGRDYKYSDGSNGKDADDGADWARVRFFAFDSQMMNGLACAEGSTADAVASDACKAVGMPSIDSTTVEAFINSDSPLFTNDMLPPSDLLDPENVATCVTTDPAGCENLTDDAVAADFKVSPQAAAVTQSQKNIFAKAGDYLTHAIRTASTVWREYGVLVPANGFDRLSGSLRVAEVSGK